MHCSQQSIQLSPRPRGFHLITDEITKQIPDLARIAVGTGHIFICHTSASLTINENASADVRLDMEQHFSRSVPEVDGRYQHWIEGPDDMPAHIKAAILGSSVTVPITNGAFNLGVWQGIYLCEHRNEAGPRKLIVTLNGKLK